MPVPNRSRKNLDEMLVPARDIHHSGTTFVIALRRPEPHPNRTHPCRRRETFARAAERVRSREFRSTVAEGIVRAPASHGRRPTSLRAQQAERFSQRQPDPTISSPPSAGMLTMSEWFATISTLGFLALWLTVSFA
jgi:hypothetical protein